jgi:hypothetical protein
MKSDADLIDEITKHREHFVPDATDITEKDIKHFYKVGIAIYGSTFKLFVDEMHDGFKKSDKERKKAMRELIHRHDDEPKRNV